MNKLEAFGAAALVTLLSAASGLAAPRSVAEPAETPSIFALPRQLTGQVVAVNQSTLMLTVRTAERTVSLKADTDTAPQLGSLKAGDRVKVSYKNSSNGEMVATRIDPA
jgi:hypothetical protein